MKTVKTYSSYNHRRYSILWIALVDPRTAKPDFSQKVGGYTGDAGEEGDLFLFEPIENAVYMYGQKDYRGNNTERVYAQYLNGEFHVIPRTDLIRVLNDVMSND